MRAWNDETRRSKPRWSGPISVFLDGVLVTVVLSLALRRVIPIFVLFLPFVWTGRRRS